MLGHSSSRLVITVMSLQADGAPNWQRGMPERCDALQYFVSEMTCGCCKMQKFARRMCDDLID